MPVEPVRPSTPPRATSWPFSTSIRLKMGVEAEEPLAVIQDDGPAVDAQIAGESDLARVGGRDLALGQRGEIDAEMGLGVDVLAVIDIGPRIAVTRHRLGVGQAEEGPRPEGLGRRFQADGLDLLGVLAALVAIDGQEDVDIASLQAGVALLEIRQDVGQELVADGDLIALEGFLLYVRPEGQAGLVADRVGGVGLETRPRRARRGPRRRRRPAGCPPTDSRGIRRRRR